MIDIIRQFIFYYYIDPIVYGTGWNPVNTLTFGILLCVILFGILKLLEKLDIEIDRQFILAVVPYIMVGGVLRVLEDAGTFVSPVKYLFITPLVHFFVLIVCIIILLTLVRLRQINKIGAITPMFGYVGVAWFVLSILILLLKTEVVFPWVPVVVVGITTVLTSAIYLMGKGSKFLNDRFSIFIIWSHLFDASSTHIGVDFLGYLEKHILPALLIELSSTAMVMYPLKLVVIIPILYILNTQFKDTDDKLGNMLKLAILMMGLSPGLRNTLRMMLGI